MKVGVGLSMEGIEQNPVIYDLMSEMAFQRKKVDVKVMSCFFLEPTIHLYLHYMNAIKAPKGKPLLRKHLSILYLEVII